MRILEAHGVWMGQVSDLRENTAIREQVVKRALGDAGFDPRGITPVGDVDPDPSEVRRRVTQIVLSQGYAGGPWAFKCPKLVFMWRAWARAFTGATWVAVWRTPADVADSLRRWSVTAARVGDGHEVVGSYQSRMLHIPAIAVHPERDARGGTVAEAQKLIRRLGLVWDEEAVAGIVDPGRWHTHTQSGASR